MADEVSGTRSQQNQDLREINEQYAKKRKALIEQKEGELSKLKEDLSKRESSLQQQRDAVINHIKQETDRQVAEVRNNSNARITYERQTLQNQYEQTKQQLEQKQAVLEKNHKDQEREKTAQLQQLTAKQTQAAQDVNQQTRLFQMAEEKKRNELARQNEAEIKALNSNTQKKKSETAVKTKAELEQLLKSNEVQLKRLQSEHEKKIEQLKAEERAKVQLTHQQTQDAIENERQQLAKSSEFMRDKFTIDKKATEALGKKDLERIAKTNEEMVKSERAKGETAVDQLKTNYRDQISEAHQSGQRHIEEQTLLHEKHLRVTEQEQNKELKQVKDEHALAIVASDKRFEAQKLQRQEEYDKNLERQTNKFKGQYTNNEKYNKAALDNQQELLNRALLKGKADFIEPFSRLKTSEADPFYRPQSFDSVVKEDENFVYVQAQIPEHEKDNVNVRVKKNQLIITGQRAFEDRIKKSDRVLTANNYQSFREIVPLKTEVATKHVERFYDNGTLTIRVPKIKL
jgi:HSP20 family molecular chaperone IbpA